MKKLILTLALLLLSATSVYALSVEQNDGRHLIINGDKIDTLNVNDAVYSNTTRKATLYLSTGEVMSYPTTYNEFSDLKEAISSTRGNYYIKSRQQENLRLMGTPEYAAQEANKAKQKAVMDCLRNARNNGTNDEGCRQISKSNTTTLTPSPNQLGQQAQSQTNFGTSNMQTNVQNGVNFLNTGLGIVRSFTGGY